MSAGAGIRNAARQHRVLAGLLAAYLMLSAVELMRVFLFDRPRTGEVGFYPRETVSLPDGPREFAWTRGVSGEILRPLYAPVVRLSLYVARPDLPESGLHVWFSVDNRVFDELVVDRDGWHRFDYYLPPILGSDPWRLDPARMSLVGVADLEPLAGEEPFLLPRWILPSKPDYVSVFTGWGTPPGPPSKWLRVQVEDAFEPAAALDTTAMTLEQRRLVDRRQLGIGVGDPLWTPALPAEGLGTWAEEVEGDRRFR